VAWSASSPSDVCEAPSSFGCKVGLCGGFYTTLDGGLEAMLCWGPSYEYNLYWGNTWPLNVVAWWFWKFNGVCEIMARIDGFQKIALLSVIRRVC